jgi:hypothetical protein
MRMAFKCKPTWRLKSSCASLSPEPFFHTHSRWVASGPVQAGVHQAFGAAIWKAKSLLQAVERSQPRRDFTS